MMSSSIVAKTTNDTKSSSKFDCAKECPCGVPVIPVPEQWLEVMVTGGFKVWHIIFIIIAFIVTIIVVYCCFHRCRIPRTKQEIEADLMRTNITNKFRDYLQEFPNEPTTFIEALKKVQELEEKSEMDDAQNARDASARKRMGWLKLKGKGGGTDKAPAVDGQTEVTESGAKPAVSEGDTGVAGSNEAGETEAPAAEKLNEPALKLNLSRELSQATEATSTTRMAISEPTAVMIDPTPLQEAMTIPKSMEASGGEIKPKAARAKRKQNLSRTKRSRALDIEKPTEQIAIKMTENVRQLHQHQSHHRHRVKIDPNSNKEDPLEHNPRDQK